MRPADLFRLALANLQRNRTRSLMTLVGVAIGVAALLALMSYGAGLQQNARSEFDALEFYNTLRVTSHPSALNAFGDLAAEQQALRNRNDSLPTVPLTDSLLQTFGQMDGVLAAYPEVVFPARLKVGKKNIPVQADAVPQAFARFSAYQPTEGTFFASAADSAVLLTPAMARRLGFNDPTQIIGEEITLETLSLHVAGLMRAAPAIAAGMTPMPLIHHQNPVRVAGLLPEDDQPVSGFVRIVLPLDYARSLRKVTFFSTIDLMLRDGQPDGYLAARVQLADADDYQAVRQQLEEAGVYVAGFRDQFSQLERLFLIMDLALAIIGFIALLVATIGIANTMMMNVMERYREIGVMKALGGDETDLQKLFIVESLTIGLVGGFFGLLLGWGITALIQLAIDYYLHRLGVPVIDVFYAPVAMVLGIIVVATLISLVAGFAPARRAARVEPIEALRSA